MARVRARQRLKRARGSRQSCTIPARQCLERASYPDALMRPKNPPTVPFLGCRWPCSTMIHAEQKTAEGIATLCDAQEADIESIIDYWYSSTEEYLADMGVDRTRLGKPEQARLRYRRALRNG